MKYRKKSIVIEATQWFKNGDHPKDECFPLRPGVSSVLSEGKIVRYYRHPIKASMTKCNHPECRNVMHDHGWIDTLEGGHTVCPGDWIITGIQGEYYPCKPSIFAATYENCEVA